jgi:hypothetical protein
MKKSFWIRKIDKSVSTQAEHIISLSEKKYINKISFADEHSAKKLISKGLQSNDDYNREADNKTIQEEMIVSLF